MASFTSYLVYAVLVVGLAYQQLGQRLIYVTAGYGRAMQPLSDFTTTTTTTTTASATDKDKKYTCRQVHDPRLQACEDMWLSDATRTLFMACSNPASRASWLPAMHFYDAAGRTVGEDAVYAVDLDAAGLLEDGAGVTAMVPESLPEGFGELAGLSLVGVDSSGEEDGAVELLVLNQKPPTAGATADDEGSDWWPEAVPRWLDPTAPAPAVNWTIERFRVERGSNKMVHLATYRDEEVIVTPNRLAMHPEGGSSRGFFFTNDHGTTKNYWARRLSPFLATGDVSYCDTSSPSSPRCALVSGSHKGPNGLVVGADGLVYVPSVAMGTVSVFEIVTPEAASGGGGEGVDVSLEHVMDLSLGIPVDNLSVDQQGDIYAAGLPKVIPEMFHHLADPLNVPNAPTTIMRIRRLPNDVPAESDDELKKREGGDKPRPRYEVVKVLEDRDAEMLPATTTVVHDAKTGRLFLSGVSSTFIAVCDPKA